MLTQTRKHVSVYYHDYYY